MFHECTHILASGRKCKAPAVDRSPWCRHYHPRKRVIDRTPFVLPEIKGRRSLLHAVSEVLQAASRHRIRRSEAGTYLFGIHLADRFMCDGGQPEASSEQIPEPLEGSAPTVYQPTIEDVSRFLATVQSTSVDHALDEWEAEVRAEALKPRLDGSEPARSPLAPSAPRTAIVKP